VGGIKFCGGAFLGCVSVDVVVSGASGVVREKGDEP